MARNGQMMIYYNGLSERTVAIKETDGRTDGRGRRDGQHFKLPALPPIIVIAIAAAVASCFDNGHTIYVAR